MAALPDNGGPRMRAEPLGSLLANRGHITEEQLELALTEQKVTGRPLGEIIVARGFAAAPTVAQALATQHGGLLKTEYGFATGWSGQEAAGEAGALIEPPRHDETATLRASLEEHQKALAAWKQSHAQLEERLAQMEQPASAEDDPRVAELEAERDALKAELAEAQKPAPPVDDPRLAELEAERDALKAELAEAQTPAPPVDDPRLNELIADRESLQAELTARDTSIAELKASRAKVESARTELEQELARESERGAAVRAELEQLQAAPAPAPRRPVVGMRQSHTSSSSRAPTATSSSSAPARRRAKARASATRSLRASRLRRSRAARFPARISSPELTPRQPGRMASCDHRAMLLP